MAQYTSNIKLHQWEPSDHFLRTDFNQDFSKIDSAFSWMEGALARTGYEALQGRLADEAKGAAPLGRGVLFDSFRSWERAAFTGGLGPRRGGGVLLDTGSGQGSFEDHFGTAGHSYSISGDSSGAKQKSFTAVGNGTLNTLTFILSAPKGGGAQVSIQVDNKTVWSERKDLGTGAGSCVFSPRLALQKGAKYTIFIGRTGEQLILYYGEGGSSFGYQAACTPHCGTSGTLISTAQTMEPFRAARAWVRHSAGTVTCELQQGGNPWQALTRMGSRQSVDCRGIACTETEFRLPIGSGQSGSIRVRVGLQNNSEAIIYDYGVVLI